MINKLFTLFLSSMVYLISCQKKTVSNDNHFRIENKQINYNNNKIYLGMPIEEFAKIVNSEYRVAKYSLPGSKTTIYYWTTKKIHVTESKDYLDVKGLDIEEKTGEYFANWKDDAPVFPKYKSLDEVIRKYGKYDSLKVEASSTQESIFYVWDKLGFNVAVHDNTVGQINLYPIHYTKRNIEYRLITPGPPKAKSDAYIDTEDKSDVENYKVMLERQPKAEFKGKFTYDGHTADFSKIGYTGWNTMVKDLDIAGSNYDPPGDSKGWGRKIWLNYDNCLIDIKRYNNDNESTGSPSKDKVGKIDGVQAIEIWRFTDEDRK
ncbi:DUF7738 domain-containing protein [Chryseobacterium vrystaatense]|uniref:DUF7738 domain-containing protein n=1 Tax=Chryseobacterium vrystaatense TaxID=307480 RepID=A0A1M5Q0J0_9FLAO|nr:hypothetical protein [Chryseobacterium vrystaatense]SHH07450.1 hypothetical protein SAMN02787073_0203 [Chryseobacterium vrystaatense]